MTEQATPDLGPINTETGVPDAQTQPVEKPNSPPPTYRRRGAWIWDLFLMKQKARRAAEKTVSFGKGIKGIKEDDI